MPKLPPHNGFAYRRSLLPAIATLAVLLAVEGFTVCWLEPASAGIKPKAVERMVAQTLPGVLSKSDIAIYRHAFSLQQAGRFDEADAAAGQANNPLLKGVLLGERYLNAGNKPSFSEIALWLARYGDHAQAGDLYRIAQERAPGDADFLTEPQLMVTFKALGGGSEKSGLSGDKHWVSGIAAYHRRDMESAAGHFKALLGEEQDELSSGDRAAVAFWAYRASNGAGNTRDAAKYLELAAEEAPGFYSILARQLTGEALAVKNNSEVSGEAEFLRKEAARRAVALKSVGQDALAEKELRALFLAGADRARLSQLAEKLGLPGAQMRMAINGSYDASQKSALYPVPRWKPTLGYEVEPALLFAIMRQESGFNPNAHNASGARGVMQLMPATASAMARDARLKLSGEPAVSMSLGQRYLVRLMDTTSISDNLVYLLAAYNAGPGSVANWQKSLRLNDDPLLFIESIPNVQTRDYVVHVMGNYWVYSEILGGYDNTSVATLAAGRWPHYERSDKQVALMLSHLPGGDE